MVQANHILGMNARVQRYTVLNSSKSKRFGFSKLRTKAFLQKHEIAAPQLFARITSLEELRDLDWHTLSGSFAVKPANGMAGNGIVVIKEYNAQRDTWIGVDDKEWSDDDLNLHVSDILAGQYSTWATQHSALIEERVPIHPKLAPYAQLGTPDVRVIVFRNIPVMAMLRLPTVQSGGKANLHQGAIALGIDFGTGKSTYGVSGASAYNILGRRELLKYFPDTTQSVANIEIPSWIDVLKTAVRTANATGLTYMGADIFLHPDKGPMVAEVNAYPGLSIQLANKAGLRRRLERLEGIEARNVSHAVKIAQSLFAESFPGADEGERIIVSTKETIIVYGDGGRKEEVRALLNTGRHRSVISQQLAEQLGLNIPDDQLWSQKDDGETTKVPVVRVKLRLKDRLIETSMIISSRLNHKRSLIELGRNDLSGFLIAGEGES